MKDIIKDKWRFIGFKKYKGSMNMAIDESISQAIYKKRGNAVNTLRLYGWIPSCVSVGFFQDIKKEVDLDTAKDMSVDVIRRLTGGGAVFHEHEITYSLIISEKYATEDIVESYEEICSCLIKGLSKLGINPVFKPINDILLNGKKISGSAQTRMNGTLIQHGTILLDLDVDKMFRLLKVPDEKIKDKIISNVKKRVTCLNDELESEVSIEKISQYIKKGFEEVFNINFIESELTEDEISLAKKLEKEKYSTKEWIYQR
ncbi:MAG: lipoate--protein ligase family protein [Candidatus Woesearchaeota archaeon]